MRGMLGGILGGGGKQKGTTLEAVEAVLKQLRAGDGLVDKDLWLAVVQAGDLADVIDEAIPRSAVLELVSNRQGPVFSLLVAGAAALQAALDQHDASGEVAEAGETRLMNYVLILTTLLSGLPVGGKEHELTRTVWGKPIPQAGEQTIGQWLLASAMRLLFLDGLTVDAEAEEEDEEADAPSGATSAGNACAVNAAVLWGDGVGPKREPEKVDNDTRENRDTMMEFLLALLCGDSPASPPPGADEEELGGDGTPDQHKNRDKYLESMASFVRAGEAASRPLVAHSHAMRHLCDPAKQVPMRAELLYSLMSTVFGYDPHGYNIPYGGYFSGNKQEAHVHTCVQVLGVLMQDPSDEFVGDHSAILSRRPQEQRGVWCASRELVPQPHVFRDLLAGLTDEDELSFVVGGVVALFGTIGDEKKTYLPRSMRLPPFLTELLVFVFHASACDNLVRSACRDEEVADLAEGLLHLVADVPDHVHEDTVCALIWSSLARLTAHREVCVALGVDFTGSVPEDLPDLGTDSTALDLVVLAAACRAGELFSSCRFNSLQEHVAEACICTLVNLAPHAQELAQEPCTRLFALLERCMKTAGTRHRSAGGSAWLPGLLEALEYIVQYQYMSNESVAYGLMTRRKQLMDLQSAVGNLAHCNGSDSTPLQNGVPREAAGTVAQKESGGGETGVGDGLAAAVEAASLIDQVSPRAQDVADWAGEVQTHLAPLVSLLDAVGPVLEAAAEQKSLSSPEEVKKHLPRSILGLLPPPPAFTARSVRACRLTHRACEHAVVACIATGPLASLWESDDREGGSDEEEESEEEDTDGNHPAVRIPAGTSSARGARRQGQPPAAAFQPAAREGAPAGDAGERSAAEARCEPAAGAGCASQEDAAVTVDEVDAPAAEIPSGGEDGPSGGEDADDDGAGPQSVGGDADVDGAGPQSVGEDADVDGAGPRSVGEDAKA